MLFRLILQRNVYTIFLHGFIYLFVFLFVVIIMARGFHVTSLSKYNAVHCFANKHVKR